MPNKQRESAIGVWGREHERKKNARTARSEITKCLLWEKFQGRSRLTKQFKEMEKIFWEVKSNKNKKKSNNKGNGSLKQQ